MFLKIHLKCKKYYNQANKHSLKMNLNLTAKLSKATLKYIDILRAQNKVLRVISYKFFMEQSEPLYNQLKTNSLNENIILNKCLFLFDNLANNPPDVFHQFFNPFKELHNHNTRRSQLYLLNIPETNTQTFGPNSIRIKSINNWHKMIHKIHFSSELLLKCNGFIELVKNTFVT